MSHTDTHNCAQTTRAGLIEQLWGSVPGDRRLGRSAGDDCFGRGRLDIAWGTTALGETALTQSGEVNLCLEFESFSARMVQIGNNQCVWTDLVQPEQTTQYRCHLFEAGASRV